jgi:thiol:disulfide interchange protein DsbD
LHTSRISRLAAAFFFLLVAGLPAWAASSSADAAHLRVELMVPGSSLYKNDALNQAGLYFKLEPGWHVYWQNPGDAGEPPHLHWTLQDGITAGPLEFPAPKRVPLGPLMDFGYEDEVLFPFTVHVAENAKPGPATLHAKVDWLVCREVCIPGKAELELSRNVQQGPADQSVNEPPLFRKFISQLPKPLPANDRAVFQPTPTGFRLGVETGQRETSASFFPEEQDILDNPAPQKVSPTAKGVVLEFKKDANLASNPPHLKGVVELSGV